MVNCCTTAINVPASDQQLRLWRNSRLSSLEGVDATLSDGTLGLRVERGSRQRVAPTGTDRPVVDDGVRARGAPGPGLDVRAGDGDALDHDAPRAERSARLRRGDGAVVVGPRRHARPWRLDAGLGCPAGNGEPVRRHVGPAGDIAIGARRGDGVDRHEPADGGGVVAGRRRHGESRGSRSPSRARRRTPVAAGSRGSRCRPTAARRGIPASGHGSWSYTFTPQTTGSLTIQARATDDSVNTGPPSADVTVTVAPHGCPCTIWDNSATPASVGNNDGLPIDYGVKFRTDVDGSISGFRFYKSPGDNGTHTGHLWDTNGNLLASMTFTNETASGWQQVDLSSPVDDHGGHHVHRLDLLVGGLLPGHRRRTSRARVSTIHRCTRSRTASTDRTPSTTRAPTPSPTRASTRATTGPTSCSRTVPTRHRRSSRPRARSRARRNVAGDASR